MASDPWQAVHQINRTWVEDRPDEMAPLLHADVVMVAPAFSSRSQGRQAAVDGYREFCDAVEIHGYAETEPQVHITGDVAVVSYRFTIEYAMEGDRHVDRGHDLFVLDRERDGWLAVWRMLIPATE